MLGIVLAGAACGQEDPFTHALRPEDYSAAGLAKLSPDERAKLDRLVEAYKSGALEAARKQAFAAAQAQAAAEARARQAEASALVAKNQEAEAKVRETEAKKGEAEAKKKSGGFFSKAVALITPGTKIEYAAVESRIIGSIKEWGPHSVFILENGQAWRVVDGSSYFNGKSVVNPKVRIMPARLVGFEMEIEGFGTMRVRLANGTTYREN